MARLNDLGEDALVARLIAGLPTQPSVLVGPGDDCAVVEGGADLELLKTDCIVEGVHFSPETDPERVGWKAAARTISDFAAMGGWPRHLLVTVVVSGERELAWLEGIYAGLSRCADEFGAAVVGGECSRPGRGEATVISVSGTGGVERGHLLTRSGGKPGDELWVTGSLGGSIAGKHLDFHPRVAEGRWLAAQAGVHAAMDLSDGLAMDLPRLARASGCGFQLDTEAIPCTEGASPAQAMGDGEDYELLVAVEESVGTSLAAEWSARFPGLRFTRVGHFVAEETGELSGGWDHFSGGAGGGGD